MATVATSSKIVVAPVPTDAPAGYTPTQASSYAISGYTPTPAATEPPSSPVTVDDLLELIANKAPGFGGMYKDPADPDVLNVYLLDASRRDAAVAAIKEVLGPDSIPQGGVKVLQGLYSFDQLRAWYGQVRNEVWRRPTPVVRTDLAEQLNRIVVEVEDASAVAEIRDRVSRTSAPSDAVIVRVGQRAVQLTPIPRDLPADYTPTPPPTYAPSGYTPIPVATEASSVPAPAACQDPEGFSPAAQGTVVATNPFDTTTGISLSLMLPRCVRVGDPVDFVLMLTNVSNGPRAIYLDYDPPSDFFVTDATGNLVWQALKGLVRPAVLTIAELEARQFSSFRASWSPVKAGTYRVTASLRVVWGESTGRATRQVVSTQPAELIVLPAR